MRAGTGLAILALLALTGASGALASWSLLLAGPALAGPFFALVLVAAWEAIALALDLALAGHRTGREPAGSGSRGMAASAGMAALTAAGGASAVLAAQWAAGPAWWLLVAAAAVAAEAVFVFGVPATLARVSGARPLARPLARPALIERLGELARRVRVPIADIEEVPADAAVTSTAVVAGGGESRRIFISSALLRDWQDEEIAVVVAHEMAHHAHHDLWRTLALDAAILAIACGVSALWGPGPGADLAARLAGLPAVTLAAVLVWVIATPLRLALSRDQERRADAFALELTGSVDQFQTAIRRLAAEHLAEERPSLVARWWYHRHPTAAERIAASARYRAPGTTGSTGTTGTTGPRKELTRSTFFN